MIDCHEAHELIEGRADEPLPPHEDAALGRHLVSCGACAAFADEMTDLLGHLGSLPRPGIDDARWDALVRAAVATGASRLTARREALALRRVMFAAAAVWLVAWLVAGRSHSGLRTSPGPAAAPLHASAEDTEIEQLYGDIPLPPTYRIVRAPVPLLPRRAVLERLLTADEPMEEQTSEAADEPAEGGRTKPYPRAEAMSDV